MFTVFHICSFHVVLRQDPLLLQCPYKYCILILSTPSSQNNKMGTVNKTVWINWNGLASDTGKNTNSPYPLWYMKTEISFSWEGQLGSSTNYLVFSSLKNKQLQKHYQCAKPTLYSYLTNVQPVTLLECIQQALIYRKQTSVLGSSGLLLLILTHLQVCKDDLDNVKYINYKYSK